GRGQRGWSVESPIDWRSHRRRDRRRALNCEGVGSAKKVAGALLTPSSSYRVGAVGREGKRIRPGMAAITTEAAGGGVEHFGRAAEGRTVPVIAGALADADINGAATVGGVRIPLNSAVDVPPSGAVAARIVGAAVGRETDGDGFDAIRKRVLSLGNGSGRGAIKSHADVVVIVSDFVVQDSRGCVCGGVTGRIVVDDRLI